MEDSYLDTQLEDQISGTDSFGWERLDDLQEFYDNEAFENAQAEKEEAYMYDEEDEY